MKLIITKTFSKKINKLKSISINDIKNLILKLPYTNLLIEIDNFENSVILKWYLNSKKIRIIILFEKIENIYFPVSLFKKESKNWYNITKENYIKFCTHDITKAMQDYKNWFYEEIKLKK